MNAALHRIVITQAGRAYIERRLAGGNSRTQALRLLRRRLSDLVLRTLLADEQAHGAILREEIPSTA